MNPAAVVTLRQGSLSASVCSSQVSVVGSYVEAVQSGLFEHTPWQVTGCRECLGTSDETPDIPRVLRKQHISEVMHCDWMWYTENAMVSKSPRLNLMSILKPFMVHPWGYLEKYQWEQNVINQLYFDGLVEDRRNYGALAMELRLPCTNPSIWILFKYGVYVKMNTI